MDYKIVDSYTDPPGLTDRFYTEKLIRVPGCYLCYLPDRESPEVGPLPAISTGHITFGSFNNFTKVTPDMMGLWSDIVKAIPGSRLVMKAKSLSDKSTCGYVIDMFKQKGIPAERIELLGWEPSSKGHLETYNRIDIALDTFPYHGTTTTCEALWMGIPVITLAGTTHASRVGVSLLSNVGLPELVATTPEEYVVKAVDLARDLEKLQTLRKCLRVMMAHSPLTDAKKFTENLEQCYRKVWKRWCLSSKDSIQ
jgi:predicted O-linked N-acetylglucosamine transferase (SPINDLY family)